MSLDLNATAIEVSEAGSRLSDVASAASYG